MGFNFSAQSSADIFFLKYIVQERKIPTDATINDSAIAG